MSGLQWIDRLLWYSLVLFSLVCGVYRSAFYISISLIMLLGLLRFAMTRQVQLSEKKICQGSAALFASIFLSVVFSNNVVLSAQMSAFLLLSFVPLVVVAASEKGGGRVECCFLLMAISLALGSVVAVWQGNHGEVRVKSLLGMMNFAGALGLLFPILLVQAIEYSRERWQKIVYVLALAMSLPGAYYNGTRAIWITMTVTLFLYMIARRNVYKKVVRGILAGILVLSLWGAGNPYVMDKVHSMVDVSVNESNLGRINLWHYSLSIFEQNPILGTGYGALPAFSGEIYKFNEELQMNVAVNRGDHVHNNMLQLLAETGIIGGSAYAFFAYAVLRTFWDRFRETAGSRFALMGLLVSVDFFLHGMLDYTLAPLKTTLLLFMVILGLVCAATEKTKQGT